MTEENLALQQAANLLHGQNSVKTRLTKVPQNKAEWGKVMGLMLAKTTVYLENELPNMNGRDLAYALGILTDKYLDMTEGRKGVINVDASQHLNVLEGVPLETLMKLAGETAEGLIAPSGQDSISAAPLLSGELYEGELSGADGLEHRVREAVAVAGDDSLVGVNLTSGATAHPAEVVTLDRADPENKDESWIG